MTLAHIDIALGGGCGSPWQLAYFVVFVSRLVQKYLLVIANDNNGGTPDAELVEVHNLSRVRCAQPIFKVNLTCSSWTGTMYIVHKSIRFDQGRLTTRGGMQKKQIKISISKSTMNTFCFQNQTLACIKSLVSPNLHSVIDVRVSTLLYTTPMYRHLSHIGKRIKPNISDAEPN